MDKILIVEDEPRHLKTLVEYLNSVEQKYEIITARNGKIACEIAQSELPNLIIMDWELPIMNGIEATSIIKQDKKTETIPIIMCTGVMMTSEDLQTAFNAGAIDFIRKPVDKTEILARVRSMLMLADYFTKKNIAENKVDLLTKQIQKQEIKQLQTDLEFKNKELTTKAMFIIQKDELIYNSIEKLNKIISVETSEIKNHLINLLNDFKLNLNEDRWNVFETHFEKVHRNFYNRLNIQFPNLTPNEKKLCAFIRLNLTTKDICAITQQSLKSIEVARTRLRHKLHLNTTENLTAFISAI
jgi:DNA-binding response OmpR family regulator/DNA-binding CsgD family transcriptional regulator